LFLSWADQALQYYFLMINFNIILHHRCEDIKSYLNHQLYIYSENNATFVCGLPGWIPHHFAWNGAQILYFRMDCAMDII